MGCYLIFPFQLCTLPFCPQIHSLSCTWNRYLSVTLLGIKHMALNKTKYLLSLSLLSRWMKGQFAWNLKISDRKVEHGQWWASEDQKQKKHVPGWGRDHLSNPEGLWGGNDPDLYDQQAVKALSRLIRPTVPGRGAVMKNGCVQSLQTRGKKVGMDKPHSQK